MLMPARCKLLGAFSALLLCATALPAETGSGDFEVSPTAQVEIPPPDATGRTGLFGIVGSMGYHSFGMNNVNNNFLNGRNGSFQGALGYGGAVKYGLSDRWSAKLGIDYLVAKADSTRNVGGVIYSTSVELPATMVLVGAEYVLVPTPAMDFKLSGGYILTSIFNGNERGSEGSKLDMGAISGSTSGLQLGAGLELFLGRGFSIGGDLAYNLAKIERASFAAAPSDPGAGSTQGVVDYSGLVAKVALTVYLIQ